MNRGKLLVIEGGVGCGKTTQMDLLKKDLKGWRFYREPGSTKFGEKIRDAVQGIHHYEVEEYAAMFGYSAARANLIIFYDLNPKIGMKRKSGHKDSDRYDVKDLKFHNRVRRSYHELGKKIGGIWKEVDASKSIEEVHQETLSYLKKYKILK